MNRSHANRDRRGVQPRRIPRSAAVLACVALLAGCAAGPSDRRHHADNAGPLSASSGQGATSTLGVTSGTSHYSYGAHLLCARKKGAKITLERVTYEAKVKPLKVEFWLRTIEANDVVKNGEEVAASYSPFFSTEGKPPDYEGKGGPDFAGTHTRDIAGKKITQSCDEMRDINTGFTDLILAMKVNKQGGHIPGITIEYKADVKKYALTTHWEMIACGTAVKPKRDDEYCRDKR